MSLSKDDILNAIAEMSVMDVVELVNGRKAFLPLLLLLLPVLLLALMPVQPSKRRLNSTLFWPVQARRK